MLEFYLGALAPQNVIEVGIIIGCIGVVFMAPSWSSQALGFAQNAGVINLPHVSVGYWYGVNVDFCLVEALFEASLNFPWSWLVEQILIYHEFLYADED